MQYPFASIRFRSTKSLEEIGRTLSEEVLGLVPFSGKEKAIWGEVPALHSLRSVLGLRIELGGGPGPEGYELRILPEKSPLESMSPSELDEFIREEGNRLRKVVGNKDVNFDESVTSKWQAIDLSEFFAFAINRHLAGQELGPEIRNPL